MIIVDSWISELVCIKHFDCEFYVVKPSYTSSHKKKWYLSSISPFLKGWDNALLEVARTRHDAHSLPNLLAAISTTPVLMIAGANDVIVPPEKAVKVRLLQSRVAFS